MADLKQIARDIFRETLAAVDIRATMQRKLARSRSRLSIPGSAGEIVVDLDAFRRVRVIAFGKASIAMAQGLAAVLPPDLPFEGILVAPREFAPNDDVVSGSDVVPKHNVAPANDVVAGNQDRLSSDFSSASGVLPELPRFRSIYSSHPVPDANSFRAAREILRLLQDCDADTLVFFLLSGGGSAIVELPLHPGVTLQDMQQLHRLLVNCGAPIDHMNAVRKHLSAVKGGRLAAAAPAALKLTLGVTDVPAGRESALGSGPTLPDPTTVADACEVIDRYALLPQLPPSIRSLFERPALIPETPKPGDPAFARAQFTLLLGADDLLHHSQRAAQAHGCLTICDNSTDDWPLSDAADYLLARLDRLARANPGRRVAVIGDGEVASPVTGNGVGGRNSAFVLDCVKKIASHSAAGEALAQIAVLSVGTDGKDGSSPAAGAVADQTTYSRALAAGLDPDDYARRCDSYTFFRALGDAIETGPTGNNLRDLRILLAV